MRRRRPGICEVWWARKEDLSLAPLDWLADEERRRADAFREEQDCARFVVGACLLRLVLAEQIGVEPRSVPLDRTCDVCGRSHGRPRMRGHHTIDVSVSHSSDQVVVAVIQGARVGIDVEDRDRSLEVGVAAVVAAPEERDLVLQGGPDVLLQLWTRKEAILKAAGVGLRAPPADVVVVPGSPARVVRLPAGISLPLPLVLIDLDPPAGEVGALAVAGALPAVRHRDGSALLRAASAAQFGLPPRVT